jgi:hypothetical protein
MSQHARRCWLGVSVISLGIGLAAAPLQKPAPPTAKDVLDAAAGYLVQYATKVSGLECEESYIVREITTGRMGETRQLRADFFLVGGNGHVQSFRDVFESVGSPIRPHDHRVAQLFLANAGAVLTRAQQWEDDGAQYLVRELAETPKPTSALEFIEKENQDHSTFKIDSIKKTGDAQLAVLKFVEQATPRLIDTPEHAPGQGRFTIDVATGAIRQSEIILSTKTADVRVTMTYALDPATGLWVPATTDEHYLFMYPPVGSGGNLGSGNVPSSAAFDAQAKFSKCQLTRPKDVQ